MRKAVCRGRVPREAELLDESGAVVAGVSGSAWQQTNPGGRLGWGGDLLVTSPGFSPLIAGRGTYTLRLPDGSEGSVSLRSVKLTASRGGALASQATFAGAGRPPASLFA